MSTVLTTAQQLALAVLQGDTTAIGPLVDAVCEETRMGAVPLPPVQRLTVDRDRLRVIVYAEEPSWDVTEERLRINEEIDDWLTHGGPLLIHGARVELYELPEWAARKDLEVTITDTQGNRIEPPVEWETTVVPRVNVEPPLADGELPPPPTPPVPDPRSVEELAQVSRAYQRAQAALRRREEYQERARRLLGLPPGASLEGIHVTDDTAPPTDEELQRWAGEGWRWLTPEEQQRIRRDLDEERQRLEVEAQRLAALRASIEAQQRERAQAEWLRRLEAGPAFLGQPVDRIELGKVKAPPVEDEATRWGEKFAEEYRKARARLQERAMEEMLEERVREDLGGD